MSNEAAKTPAAFRISELLESSGRWGDHRIWSH